MDSLLELRMVVVIKEGVGVCYKYYENKVVVCDIISIVHTSNFKL